MRRWSAAGDRYGVIVNVCATAATGTAEQEVVTTFAKQNVVAGLAEQLIIARAAGDRVIASATEQVSGRQRAVRLAYRDRVVAVLSEHLDQTGVGDGRGAAYGNHRAAVHENLPGRIAAGHDRVTGGVIDECEHTSSRGKA